MSGIPVSPKDPAKLDESPEVSLRQALGSVFMLRLEVKTEKERSRTLERQLADSQNDLATMTRLNAELDAQLKALQDCKDMLKRLSQHHKDIGVGIDGEVAKLEAAARKRARPSAPAGAPAPAAEVKKEKHVRHNQYPPPSGGGGAAAGSSVRVVESASAVRTHKNFCQCKVGGEAIWYEHNFQLLMCDDCKIHHEKLTFDEPPEFSRMDGAYFVREASPPLPARGLGGAAGPRVVMSAPGPRVVMSARAGPADTDVCSCKQRVVQWFCRDCSMSMCDVCEGNHRVTGQWEAHKVTKLPRRPSAGNGSRP